MADTQGAQRGTPTHIWAVLLEQLERQVGNVSPPSPILIFLLQLYSHILNFPYACAHDLPHGIATIRALTQMFPDND